jgi:hypothetical protein
MRSLLAILLGTTLILSTSSCNEKRGCTDVNSDNYDENATQDDDTCIPTVEKFLGEYEGYGQNNEFGSDEYYENVLVNITDSTTTEPNTLIILIQNFDLSTNTFDAVVNTKFEFEVPLQTISGANTLQYSGRASVSNRILRMDFRRSETIVEPDTTYEEIKNYTFYALKVLED